jgi:glycosyltransferase involved in cell wall biosynthesis
VTADHGRVVRFSVVLPVYNEPDVERVVRDVVAMLDDVVPDAGEVVVVDDGSTDGTPAVLDRLARELAMVEVLTQVPNQGHGPALLRGFDAARGEWIGHLDSDDQIPAAELARCWNARDGYQLVLGNRADRNDPPHRLVLSAVVRQFVRVLARRRLRDANVPCKVLTRELWQEVRPLVPGDTFAPSIALAVVAARRGRPILVLDVTHRARRSGETTLKPGRLARAVLRSTRQTAAIARRA